MSSARQAEIDKYSVTYRDRDYGMARTRQRDIERILKELRKGSLLDVSTGRGETLKLASGSGFKPVQGTEVVDYLLKPPTVVYAEAHDLPFKDKSFDHVTCFDVLEHLLLDDIVPALQEFYRVARRTVTVSACDRSHVYKGIELHVSAMPMDEWHKLITETWSGGYRHGNAGKYSGMWQIKK